MTKSIKYLVVVHPPKPERPRDGTTTYTVGEPPTVQQVTASSAEAAAQQANVSPGGYCLVAVVADVKRFDRAKIAPLEQRYADGTPLPMAGPA